MNNQINKTNYIYNLFFGITTFCTIISSANFVSAQIVPDNTLPNNSQVKVEGNINKIEGGTTRSGNLFHSFEKFGVPTGSEAHFNNAVDISNIITRVTGKSISDIDGLIKANGSANLFLINPNGIVFGNNARLDIGGSFVGSTAESFKFGDDVEFSAKNPQQTPLLTMNVPMGLQYGMNPGNIQVKGDGEGIKDSSEIPDTQNGLQVKSNQTLALVGGDINLEGATLKTGGGRIELGSVAAPGLVNIAPVEKGFSFDYDAVDGGNIELSQQTAVDASGEGAGDIRLWGRNIKISDGSLIETSTLGSEDGGSLVVNAQESVEVIGKNDSQFTALFAAVYPQATGKGADLTIKTNDLLVKDDASVGSRTFGEGNGGSLIVNAQDVQLIGDSTSLFASAEENSTGNAGDIAIQTNNLLVKDDAIIIASTSGKGNGGNLSIDAQDVLLRSGSNLFALSGENSTGDTGDITIKTNSLLAKDGVIIGAGTFGKGNGGDLTVKTNSLLAKDRVIIGADAFGEGNVGNLSIDAQDVQITTGSSLSTGSRKNSTGDLGNLMIKTNTLLVKDGAQVSTSTFEEGKGGDLIIETNNLLIKDGASVYANTFGQGNAGNLTVDAQNVQLIGKYSNLSTLSGQKSPGDAGNITIKTNNLLVKNGASINTGTLGEGNAGNLSIYAVDVQLIDGTKDGQSITGLSADSYPNSKGDAGDITIKTNNLLVKDGARVTNTTSGQSKGGNLSVDAQNIQLIGTNINGQFPSGLSTSAQSNSTGDAGNLTIKTNDLLIKDGAQINVSSFGKGKGGDLAVDAQNIQIVGESFDGQFFSLLSASAEENSTGDAGNLIINADILQLEDEAGVSVESFGTGKAGNLTINADSIRLNNDALISANTRNNTNSDTEQATINIKSQELIMRRGSNIFTNATGENVIGGNINIDTDLLIANENSDISANSENSRGGNVRIDAKSGVFGTQFRSQPTPQSDITATGATENSSGSVEIITPQTDPTSGSIQFPTIPVDTEIADVCSTPGYAQSSFTITGKGSLPPSPLKPLTGRLNRTKLATLNENEAIKKQQIQTRKKEPSIKPIVEARGWIRTPEGKIILVAYNPQNQNYQTMNNSGNCNL